MNNKEENKKTTKAPEEIRKDNQEIATIMPTMIDDSEEQTTKKRDISSIIPQNNNYELSENTTSIELISKDNILKSDGTASIATIDENNEITMKANFSFPEQIDIEKRKEENKTKSKRKQKKEKITISKAVQKLQNTTSLVSLIIIIALIIIFYFIKNAPTKSDFIPLTVKIELGEKLPIRTKAYVKPGLGQVDEMLYAIDTSKVIIEEAGEYEFTVTYQGISKTGKIIIEDTTKPELKTRNVSIIEGETYDAASFVDECKDWSGCNYSFQDINTTTKYNTPGVYTVYVVATDAFSNSTTKQASLYIEAEGEIKTYVKETPFDFNTGHLVNEKYELHYRDTPSGNIMSKGIYSKEFKYQDELKYEQAAKTYNGEPNYTCDDSKLTIIYKNTIYIIGSNYSRQEDIENYLQKEGYIFK